MLTYLLDPHARGLRAWRWLFLNKGSATRWVSSEREPLFSGFKMIIANPKNWILAAVVYGAASSISINSFFPTVVASFSRSTVVTLLLTAPPYLLACIVCALHTVGPLATAMVKLIIACAIEGIGPRYFGAMIMLPGIYTGFNMSMVWTANTNNRPPAKRAAAVAFNNALSGVSGMCSSYLHPDNAGRRFILAFGVNAGMAWVAIIASAVLRFVLKCENRRLEQKEREEERAGQNISLGISLKYLLADAGW
ncbi:MFS general substrate transporter [Hypoxylon sp. FL1150]|nr:MFS general substrate transporter [Hypoxylon sp. FL1150]